MTFEPQVETTGAAPSVALVRSPAGVVDLGSHRTRWIGATELDVTVSGDTS